MKKTIIATAVAIAFLVSPALAGGKGKTRIYDEDSHYVGYIEGGRIYDSGSHYRGKIEKQRIYDEGSRYRGRFEREGGKKGSGKSRRHHEDNDD